MRNALTIAGSDSCGGAGIQADLKSFSANGVYGMSVITAITAQNTQGVFAVQDITPDIISKQIDVIFEDIDVHAVKIGMVSQIESIKAIASSLRKYSPKHIVVDPVMISKSGYDLLSPDAKETLIKELLPVASVVTPNLPEAEAILGYAIEDIATMKQACLDLIKLGPEYVLLKGGHLEGSATDVLYDGSDFHVFEQERIDTKHTHGTGCTLSSAIAANLSKGADIKTAVINSKEYITGAIAHGFELGQGVGPTHHFYKLYQSAGMNK